MDSNSSIVDVIRCDLCDSNTVDSYCDFCLVNLCKPCIGRHISDGYDKHKINPFRLRRSTLFYPKCLIHPNKTCDLLCTETNKYICTLCCALGEIKAMILKSLKAFVIRRKLAVKWTSEN